MRHSLVALTLLRRVAAGALLAVLTIGLSACSDDDAAPPAATSTATAQPTSTRTSVPTSTATPSPTETPTPPPHEHAEIIFGSTEAGAGDLNTMYDAPEHEHADFDTCLGGEGDECIGGIAVFSSDSPGYERTDEDLPEVPLYQIDDGTTLEVEVVSIDEGLSLHKDGAVADAPGETLVLGTIPELDHTHVDYVIVVPGGTVGWEKTVTLRLVDPAGVYGPSSTRTLTFQQEDAE